MKKGDHIYIYLRGEGVKFTHHGIYIGDDRVIHYWNGKVRRSKIYKSTWYGKTIHIKKHKDSYENSRVVKRAKKRLGERKYHLICNNCEHFAYWCKTGKHKSTQVNEAPLKFFKKAEKTVKKKIWHEKKKLDKIIKKIKIYKMPKIKRFKFKF